MAGAHVLVAAHYLQEKGRSMVCSEVRRSFSVFFFLFLFSLLFPFLFLSDYIFWYRCLLLFFIFLLPHVPFHRSRDLSWSKAVVGQVHHHFFLFRPASISLQLQLSLAPGQKGRPWVSLGQSGSKAQEGGAQCWDWLLTVDLRERITERLANSWMFSASVSLLLPSVDSFMHSLWFLSLSFSLSFFLSPSLFLSPLSQINKVAVLLGNAKFSYLTTDPGKDCLEQVRMFGHCSGCGIDWMCVPWLACCCSWATCSPCGMMWSPDTMHPPSLPSSMPIFRTWLSSTGWSFVVCSLS